MFVFCAAITYTIGMRVLMLFLSIMAVSIIGILASTTVRIANVSASTTMAEQFTNEATSANAVVQMNGTGGALEYITEVRISAAQMLTVTQDLAAFETEHLKGTGGLPIDQKKQTIKDYDGTDITFDYFVNYAIRHNNAGTHSTVSMRIIFGNFYSYVKYNDLALTRVQVERSLFFIERTTKFNAYTKFFDSEGQSKKSAAIVSEFNKEFDLVTLEKTPKPEYLYVLAESMRRSETNATKTESEFGDYTYYFKVANDRQNYVEIFDRRPNTPIWYGIAVGATVIAMGLFYIYIKSDMAIKKAEQERQTKPTA